MKRFFLVDYLNIERVFLLKPGKAGAKNIKHARRVYTKMRKKYIKFGRNS